MTITCANISCNQPIRVTRLGWLIDYVGLVPERFCEQCQSRLDRFVSRIKADLRGTHAFTLDHSGENP